MHSRKKKNRKASTNYIGTSKTDTSTVIEKEVSVLNDVDKNEEATKVIEETTESEISIIEPVVIEQTPVPVEEDKTEVKTLEVETPKRVQLPDMGKRNKPHLILNKNMVKQYNRCLIKPGDVVITTGVFDYKEDIENELIAGSHRPIFVVWCDGTLARGLPLCSKPGIVGSIT